MTSLRGAAAQLPEHQGGQGGCRTIRNRPPLKDMTCLKAPQVPRAASALCAGKHEARHPSHLQRTARAAEGAGAAETNLVNALRCSGVQERRHTCRTTSSPCMLPDLRRSAPSSASHPSHNRLHVALGLAHNVAPQVGRQAHFLRQQAALHAPSVEEQAAARGGAQGGEACWIAGTASGHVAPAAMERPASRRHARRRRRNACRCSLLEAVVFSGQPSCGKPEDSHRAGSQACLSGTRQPSESTSPARRPLLVPTARAMGVSTTLTPCLCSSSRSCQASVRKHTG